MATYDWTSPTLTTNYTTFVTELHNRLDQVAKGFNSADTHNNIPVDTISFRSSKWQKWTGSAWSDLASSYAISISGTASNIIGTLAVANGGTNITSYTVGDLVYANGSTSLAKLTAVATGNVLISGGASTAPSWGKVGLTTHVSGTLSVANGGTGATTLSGILKGNGTGAIVSAVAGTDYAAVGHNHDATYAALSHNHDTTYAPLSHNHDTAYAALSHTHSYLALTGGTLTGNLSLLSGTGEMAITLGSSGAYLYGNTINYGIYRAGAGSLTFDTTNGNLTVSGNVTAYSDIRLKTNIKTLESALDKVLQLRGVSYTKAGTPEIGVIAQEVEKIIPEVVCNTGEYKAVAYGNLVALLIEAIKELDRKVDARTCN